MERNRKLTVNIPPHIIEEYGINEDTVFVTYLDKGKLVISVENNDFVEEDTSEDEFELGFQEGYEEGFDDGKNNGRMEGYDKGYRYGYSDAIIGKRFDPKLYNAESFLDSFDCDVDGCEECQYFNRETGSCTVNN